MKVIRAAGIEIKGGRIRIGVGVNDRLYQVTRAASDHDWSPTPATTGKQEKGGYSKQQQKRGQLAAFHDGEPFRDRCALVDGFVSWIELKECRGMWRASRIFASAASGSSGE